MADSEFGRETPFAFLRDLANRFQSMYGQRAKGAFAGEMQAGFAPILSAQLVC